jgi:ADP-L-glycero-D-manno-heptose 6-epimerase
MIIITGGSGFIGSCLISRLNSVGFDDIIVVDNFNTSLKWKNLVGKKFRELIERDHAFEYLSSLQESPKAVVHLGACSSPAQTDFGYLLRNNLHFSQRIALLSQEWGAKLVYASSAGT